MNKNLTEQCAHEKLMPIETLNALPECQAQEGRHKCAICAFNEGIAVAKGNEIFGAEGEKCSHDQYIHYAPKEMLEKLPENQGGSGRHKCVYHAYQLGIESVITKSIGSEKIINLRKKIPENTEKIILQKSRLGQDIFRNNLLSYWKKTCPLTGITDTKLLRASHIKPWSKCNSNDERLNVSNGLLLSSLWDAAFDSGLVSFENNGDILIAEKLTQEARTALKVNAIKPIDLSERHHIAMEWHRNNSFLG